LIGGIAGNRTTSARARTTGCSSTYTPVSRTMPSQTVAWAHSRSTEPPRWDRFRGR
jgi:hypothetical protein